MGKVAVQPEAARQAGPQWFVVQTQVHREREARKQLMFQRFEVYLPMRLASHRNSKNPITPFLPRHLFVRFDPSITQWLTICSTIGVHDIIRKGNGQPAAVPGREIERVRGWERDGVIHLLPPEKGSPKANPFKRGDRVKLTDGRFEGMEAIVHKVNDAERVMLFLRLVEGGESGFKMSSHVGSLRAADVR